MEHPMISRIRAERSMSVAPKAWLPGERIPTRYTADGDDVSPPFDLANVPREAQTLALIFEDPDAPRGTFTHWTAWNLSAETGELPEAADVASMGGRQGRNDFGGVGYRGPAPPPGEQHRYYLVVYAVRGPITLREGVPRDQLEAALEGHVVARGETWGTYRRP